MNEIEAIFLDVGNTLRVLTENEAHQSRARQIIVDLVGTNEDPIAFCAKLDERYKIYRKWAFENLRETPESELWTRWLAPDFPAEHIAPLGRELTYQYRQSMGLRVMVERAREVVEELHARGYTLGIISNVITSQEIPDWLKADDLERYFKSVVLSSVLGIRKPDPAIYLEAARIAGVAPEKCAYVGDNLKRDVSGTRNAGFGMAIIMMDAEKLAQAEITNENKPDAIIHKFDDLLTFFPRCPLINMDGLQGLMSQKERQKMQTKMSTHGGIALAKAVRGAYARGQTDYSMEPLVRLNTSGKPMGSVQDGDAVIFCCRRGEREIELTEAFTDIDFPHFQRSRLDLLNFVILTLYHEKFKDLPVAFAPAYVRGTLGEVVSRSGLHQLRCSESEKYAHVTFFINGGSNEPFAGETDIRIPSPKGIPFDQIPQLSLPEVADEVIEGIQSGYDLIITNFANGDVIGHTSNADAKIRCAEIVDHHLGKVVRSALQNDMIVVITADHGNLEVMLTPEGKPHVAHTSNPVPLIVMDARGEGSLAPLNGSLADLAPTILAMLGLEPSPEMTGQNLLSGHAWGKHRRILLIILDGWGIGKDDHTNPIYLAQTPTWDDLYAGYAPANLCASGEAVGLQADKPGNSEAGHMNIGAGRVILQDDVHLEQAMQDGSFYTNETFLQTIDRVKAGGSHLHLIGLLTEKSSHGSINYPLALLKMAKERGLDEVYLHIIFDGRSTQPGSAPQLLEKLEDQMHAIGAGQIVTGVGRGLALDRDGNYGKIKKAYDVMVNGIGQPFA